MPAWTRIIQRLGDRITPPWHGRYLASRIAGAQYFEQPGDHSLRFAGSGDSDALCQEISAFLADAGTRQQPEPERALATILAAAADPEPGARMRVQDHGGRMLTNPGAGILATFSTPGHPLRPVAAVRRGGGGTATWLRYTHPGGVALGGDEAATAAVRIAQDVAALASPAEILVSRTVKDLLAGSGYDFADRASDLLPGAAESWQLYAVTTAAGGR